MSVTKVKHEAPTKVQYSNLQLAYDYFNAKLFDGKLAPCMITLRGQNKRCMGLFHAEQWQSNATAEDKCHEIALTPCNLDRPLEEVFSTLVHEMVHLWQQDHGEPSRNGYHNKEWGGKMKDVGLFPSNTGKEGGKETGQQMIHYVIDGGPFAVVFKEMPDHIKLPWIGVPLAQKTPKGKNKVKYVCFCDDKFWAKPGLSVTCDICSESFQEQE